MEAGTLPRPGRSAVFDRSGRARLPDQVLRWGLTGIAGAILLLIAYFFVRLVTESSALWSTTSVIDFVFSDNWVPSKNAYGPLPLVVGTLIPSALALLMGVPVAVATALYLTELCPRRLRGPLTIMVELLAAVPSVV